MTEAVEGKSPAEILSEWDQDDANRPTHDLIKADWWRAEPAVREVAAPTDGFGVFVQQLFVLPHPNADALELAVVGGVVSECMNASCVAQGEHNHEMVIGGFRAVVPKGQYKTGDYAVYIPEAAMLPDALIEELGLVGRLAGSGKNRVKAIRLRGELSQGIVCRPEQVRESRMLRGDWANAIPGDEIIDFAPVLGIIKHTPRVPAAFRGKIRERGNSEILGWVDIPNIKKDMRMFEEGEPIVATEKIHDTCCLITYDVKDETLMVSSKGMAKQGWDLLEEEGNVYWRAVRAARLEELLKWIAENVAIDVDRIGLYGEVFGAGIQDLDYGFTPEEGPQFIAFDLRYDDMWVNYQARTDVLVAASLATGIHSLQQVPVLYRGPFDYTLLCELAEGRSWGDDSDGLVKGGSYVGGRHVMEGLVVRPQVERRARSGGRAIAKFINPSYLTRKGLTTEFE
jgi:RNA ligase (TIGR02306 family)